MLIRAPCLPGRLARAPVAAARHIRALFLRCQPAGRHIHAPAAPVRHIHALFLRYQPVRPIRVLCQLCQLAAQLTHASFLLCQSVAHLTRAPLPP